MRRSSKGPLDHGEELAELQKRFNHLNEQQKTSELHSSSLMLATRKSGKSGKSTRSLRSLVGGEGEDSERFASMDTEAKEEELRRLDEQIVALRRKNDQLHEKNAKKRTELDTLADKLKDLHNTKFAPKESPESRLAEMETRLVECAARYDEQHRLRMSYEQVIARLKKEHLEWPADIKQLETVLSQKEQDYEQLLVMSHDANSSKEAAKVELGKFEALVLEERKQREKELQERRAILQKKQQLATELDRTERERRQQLLEAQKAMGEDAAKAEAVRMDALIKEEQMKISAYEAAFTQIKEATGVSDVNEVIQRFLLQEETHQNLVAMVKESQQRIDELQRALEEEKALVMSAEYTMASGAEAEGEDQGSMATRAAQKQLSRARDRWKKALKTMVNTKSAVQHIVDILEPLREKDEVIAPMSDETLLQHMQFAESKIALIAQAFFEMEEEHKELLASVSSVPVPSKPPAAKKELGVGSGFDKNLDDSDDEFEEDMEEDVMDRNALKKQSTSIVDKGTKKKKGGRRRKQ